jgi:WD40 repeat protein
MSAYDQEHSAVYGQRLNKSRCLTSVLGDAKHHRFFVGTLSLHSSENEVHLIQYSEDQDDVYNVATFRHPHEIWSISPHPSRPELFFTVYNTGKTFESVLWEIPASIYGNEVNEEIHAQKSSSPTGGPALANKFVIQSNEQKSPLHCVLWDPLTTESSGSDRVLTVDSQNVKEWRIDNMKKADSVNVFSVGRRLGTGRWDPHHNEIVAVAAQTKIIQLDMRTNKPATSVENAHEHRVRDFEFNPYNPYFVASGGDDCKVKFWDMRNTKEPLRVLCGHSHWITSVKFNPSYDQLLLSCSTDCLVNLWSIPTISSKSVTENIEEELEEFEKELDQNSTISDMDDDNKSDYTATSNVSVKRKVANMNDTLVQSIDEHEESVYSVAWSACNSWVFGSVSYDGRVLIHHVKSSERLKILDMPE